MLRRFTIQTRLTVAFSALALLVALLSAAAWLTSRLQNQSVNRFNHHVVLSMKSADELWVAMLSSRNHEKDMLLSIGDMQALQALRADWKQDQERAIALLDDITARVIDDTTIGRLKQIGSELKAYREAAAPVFDQIVAGTIGDSLSGRQALQAAAGHLGRAEATLLEARGAVAYFTGVVMDKLNGLYVVITWAVVAALVVSIALVAALAWRVSRSIVLPLRETGDFAARVGAGDLTTSLQPVGSDEVARLQGGLVVMRDALRATVSQVRQATDNITNASTEIASGNLDLSSRTEEAASSLQQTASSMEQLTSTVKQSADAARQANQLASSASSVASRGGQVVSQVVATMDEINT
ncbi:methyl-accepting chemotaxis protein, partial [Caldimonas mangrovi]|uniref:methyl-accepting chemotaxis protein n=1 Tax=Caldimonas mangrovi TaxID=2944811 RepID=UPI0024740056